MVIDRLVKLLVCAAAALQLPVITAAQKNPWASTTSVFVEGDLGTVAWPQAKEADTTAFPAALQQAATKTFQGILKQHLGAVGDEDVRAESNPHVDREGNYHIRMRQYVGDLPVQAASMVVHVRGGGDGTVYAINGDFSPSDRIVQSKQGSLTCQEAMKRALAQSDIRGGKWISSCQEAAVRGDDGVIYLGFERTIVYEEVKKAKLFATGDTGDLVAIQPLVLGARSLDTRDCDVTKTCTTVSRSSNPISTSNYGVNGAHNYAILFYNFFKAQYGRDSLNNKGMRLVSNVDILSSTSCPDNAYWDGNVNQMFYCPESSTQYAQASDPDTVFHELMHGLTQYSADLLYQGESGALNEGFSDIFAATLDRVMVGKSIENTWKLFEDCYKDGVSYLRSMSDPAAEGQTDYYPDRYKGTSDYGGVHTNSGIINLAFFLMTQGGTHPRQKTKFTVAPLDGSNFNRSIKRAARLFYNALTGCLTERSGFAAARRCTLLFAGSQYNATVADAWAAVGVGQRATV